MDIIRNDKLIKRNGIIGQVTSLTGLLLLVGSLAIVWFLPDDFLYAWIAMLLGFLLSQLGIFYGTRWGKRPRPDERLDEAFKGMDGRYTLYHYATKVAHLLVGPAGIWVLLPRMVNGKVYWEKGRYRNRVKGAFKNYLRLFGQDSMGRPELELGADIEAIRDYLKKKLPEAELPEVQGAFVVLNETVEIEAEDAPYATVTAKKLKELSRDMEYTLINEATGSTSDTFKSYGLKYWLNASTSTNKYAFGGSEATSNLLTEDIFMRVFDEAEFHDLVARLETVIDWSDTRVAAFYRLNALADDAPPANRPAASSATSSGATRRRPPGPT